MKKIVLLFITIAILFSCKSISAQERTVYLNGGSSSTYDGYGTVFRLDKDRKLTYTGTAADTLKYTNQDSIAFILQVGAVDENSFPTHFYANFYAKGLTGTDTTFKIESDYKINDRDSWTQLVPDVTSAVTPTTGVSKAVTSLGIIADYSRTQTVAAFDVPFTNPSAGTADTLEFPQQTYTITEYQNPALHYRILRFLVIISGDDSVGTGIEIEEVEIVFL